MPDDSRVSPRAGTNLLKRINMCMKTSEYIIESKKKGSSSTNFLKFATNLPSNKIDDIQKPLKKRGPDIEYEDSWFDRVQDSDIMEYVISNKHLFKTPLQLEIFLRKKSKMSGGDIEHLINQIFN